MNWVVDIGVRTRSRLRVKATSASLGISGYSTLSPTTTAAEKQVHSKWCVAARNHTSVAKVDHPRTATSKNSSSQANYSTRPPAHLLQFARDRRRQYQRSGPTMTATLITTQMPSADVHLRRNSPPSSGNQSLLAWPLGVLE